MADNLSSLALSYYQNCSSSSATVLMASSFIFAKCFLLLPLSLFVLYLGHKRWRQQRSFATTSHSDIFTYHSAALGLIYTLGVIFNLGGLFFGLMEMLKVGSYLCVAVLPGETFFNILTCVERYLAVVHPVVYLRSRQPAGVRLRNISIGCVWLLYFGWMAVEDSYSTDFPYILYFCFLSSSLVVVSFCSLSILHVLIRPGPGEMARDRPRVDRAKQKAFYTVTAILGVLLFSFWGYLVSIALVNSHVLIYTDECLVLMFGYWCSLPSSLVLPAHFLQRSRKNVLLSTMNKDHH